MSLIGAPVYKRKSMTLREKESQKDLLRILSYLGRKKKILREGEKKQEKLRKKLEYQEKNQVKIQLQNSF